MRFGKCANCKEYCYLPEEAMCKDCNTVIVYFECDTCGYVHAGKNEDLITRDRTYSGKTILCGKCESHVYKQRDKKANLPF